MFGFAVILIILGFVLHYRARQDEKNNECKSVAYSKWIGGGLIVYGILIVLGFVFYRDMIIKYAY